MLGERERGGVGEIENSRQNRRWRERGRTWKGGGRGGEGAK